MMKAVIHDKYGAPGDVLRLGEIEKPVPGDDEVLVRVRAASVHPDVWHVVTGIPYILRLMGGGLSKPKSQVPGTDMAGVVESAGKSVSEYRPGDEVFGESLKGFQWANGGAFAEYVAVSQNALAGKPKGVTFEQAAAIPTSGIIAHHNLRGLGKVQAGQRVLVNGAGGGVGSITVQLAKALGARVTGVDCARKLDMIRAFGADHVIDYAKEDFTRSGERYDIIVDVASNLSLAGCKQALTPKGVYVLIGHDHYGAATGHLFGSLPRFFKLMLITPFVDHLPAVSFAVPDRKEIMPVLQTLLAEGKLTPVIDRSFPLDAAVEAMDYLASGKACGKIMITMAA